MAAKSRSRKDNPERRSAELSPKQWQTLVNAPAVIYFLVAGAAGKLSAPETGLHAWLIASRNESTHPLMQRMLEEAPEALDAFCDQVADGVTVVEVELLHIAEIINTQLTTATAACVRRELYDLAEAAGRLFPGFFGARGKLNRRKASRLEMIALSLCVFERTSLFHN